MDLVNETEVGFSKKIKEVKFGYWTFSPKHQTITDGTIQRELEPLLFSILTYLIQNNDRIISRQELVDEVWKQAYVDDNAINRAMSELRKVLKSDKQKAQVIKTHYRKGYSFLLDIEIVQHSPSKPTVDKPIATPENEEKIEPNTYQQPPSESPKQTKSSFLNVKWAAVFGVFILATLLIVTQDLYKSANNEVMVPLETSTTLLSWKKGTSFTPQIAPSKKFLAYSFSPSADRNINLYIKDMTTLKEYKIAESEADVFTVGWSRNDDLYYQLIQNGDKSKCELWKVSISTNIAEGQHSKLFNCNSDEIMSVDAVDQGNSLLYTKYNYRNRPDLSAIVSRDLSTGNEFQVSSPNISDFGDYFVKSSNSQDRVIFLRSKATGTKIYVANIDGSNQSEIANVPYYISSVSWSETDDSIFWIDAQSKSLMTYSFENRKTSAKTLISEYELTNKFGLQVISDKRLLVATDYMDLNIAQIKLDESNTKVSEYSNTDMYEMFIAPFNTKAGSIYTVGAVNISLWSFIDEVRTKVLDLKLDNIVNIAMSPDDNFLMIARPSEVLIYDVSDFKLHDKIEIDGVIKDASWPLNSQLLLTYNDENTQSSWFYNLEQSKLVKISNSNIKSALMIDARTILYVDDKQQVSKQNIESGDEEFIMSLSDAGETIWTADKNNIYYTTGGKAIYKKPLKSDSKAEKLIELKHEWPLKLSIQTTETNPALFVTVVDMKDNLLLEMNIKEQTQ